MEKWRNGKCYVLTVIKSDDHCNSLTNSCSNVLQTFSSLFIVTRNLNLLILFYFSIYKYTKVLKISDDWSGGVQSSDV